MGAWPGKTNIPTDAAALMSSVLYCWLEWTDPWSEEALGSERNSETFTVHHYLSYSYFGSGDFFNIFIDLNLTCHKFYRLLSEF